MGDPVDTEGRYADDATVKAAAVSLCLECGCWVGDRGWHDGWHYQLLVDEEPWVDPGPRAIPDLST